MLSLESIEPSPAELETEESAEPAEPEQPAESAEPAEPAESVQEIEDPPPKRRGRPPKAEPATPRAKPATRKAAKAAPKTVRMKTPVVYESSSEEEMPLNREDMDTMLMSYLLQRKHAQQDHRRTMWTQMAGLS